MHNIFKWSDKYFKMFKLYLTILERYDERVNVSEISRLNILSVNPTNGQTHANNSSSAVCQLIV